MRAIANHNWYSKNSYIIRQSAASLLSPLCEDMEAVQRLNAGGVEQTNNLR